MSGPPLGRPPKQTAENDQKLRNRKRQQRLDELYRIPIEGKRRFGLDRIIAKLPETSESDMVITFIVMNLDRWLQKLFFAFFFCWGPARKQLLNNHWGGTAPRRQILLFNGPP